MNNRRLIVGIGAVVLLAAVIGGASFVYIYATGGSGKASAPISAPALSQNTNSQRHFRIVTNGSQVQFTLTEDLFGKPNTVVGKTNQVAGDIVIDTAKPGNSQIGTIRIDARTLATDSGMRDRMIRGSILATSQDKYEFVSFAPTAISGLPDTVAAGQSYTFQITGNLTVRDVTKPVTFSTTAKLVGDTSQHLEGSATATVKRTDFNLQIPSVPTVANVSDEVKLEIDFVAPEVSAGATATQAATSAS